MDFSFNFLIVFSDTTPVGGITLSTIKYKREKALNVGIIDLRSDCDEE